MKKQTTLISVIEEVLLEDIHSLSAIGHIVRDRAYSKGIKVSQKGTRITPQGAENLARTFIRDVRERRKGKWSTYILIEDTSVRPMQIKLSKKRWFQ